MGYKQLSVVIKMHQFDMDSDCSWKGMWHMEGTAHDDIAAVGIYYFDVSNGDSVYFDEHYLEIAQKSDVRGGAYIDKVPINQNDCIVLKNSARTKHRAVINTKSDKSSAKRRRPATRSMLCFFLVNPDNEKCANQKSADCKW